MFQFQDCLSTSGVFNDHLRKSFQETFDPKRSDRLWFIPGHIIYTTSLGHKLHTCDAKPFDAPSVTGRDCVEITITTSPVIDLFFNLSNPYTRMFVVLYNGDVLIFEYRTCLFEWARVGFFNVNIISPNSNNNDHSDLTYCYLSTSHNAIYWTEKLGDSDMNLVLYRRSLAHPGAREITQSTISDREILLTNCPQLELFEIKDAICIIPHIPTAPSDIFFLLSPNFSLHVFSLREKCLWRGIFTKCAIDFVSLCCKTVGLWGKVGGAITVCHVLDSKKDVGYLLQNNILYAVHPNGEISKQFTPDFTLPTSCTCYVYLHILCVFASDVLEFYSIEHGLSLQKICLKKFLPIQGLWSYCYDVSSFGFYTDSSIQRLHFKSLKSVLKSDDIHYLQSSNILVQDDAHVVLLLKDLIQRDFKMVRPLQHRHAFSSVLQSEALLMALFQTCRETPLEDKSECTLEFKDFISQKRNEKYPNTKLNKMLQLFVDCYFKIEHKHP